MRNAQQEGAYDEDRNGDGWQHGRVSAAAEAVEILSLPP
jgi:hypothetical protein